MSLWWIMVPIAALVVCLMAVVVLGILVCRTYY